VEVVGGAGDGVGAAMCSVGLLESWRSDAAEGVRARAGMEVVGGVGSTGVEGYGVRGGRALLLGAAGCVTGRGAARGVWAEKRADEGCVGGGISGGPWPGGVVR
jgi:hypothetical protein